nr:IPT/TIG domain-containing protein [candidate division KSB1 bacterium]
MRKIIFLLLMTSAAIAFFIGCEADNPASIYDSNKEGDATPVLTKLLPEESTLAGIGEITLQGSNFSTIPENNLVYFDKTLTTVVSASESQITVKSPNILGDTIAVKIAV